MKKVSLVIPMYYEEEVAEECYNRVEKVLKNIDSYFIITDRLFTYASEHTETRYIVDKHLSKMLNAAVWLSYKMPFKDRLYIARRCIKDYKRYVSGKNILILQFKSFLKK